MTAAIEIYTRPGCGYCGAANSLLTRRKKKPRSPSTMSRSTQRFVGKCRTARRRRCDLSADFHRRNPCRRGGDELYALDREGKLDSMLAGKKANS